MVSEGKVCLFDPLKLASCDNDLFPPPIVTCQKCLIKCVGESMSCRDHAEAMRWFVGFCALFEQVKKDGEVGEPR